MKSKLNPLLAAGPPWRAAGTLRSPALAARGDHQPKLDTGDTAWMLTSTALVLMMTIPGLALFYGGMVRKKNVLATVMQSFAVGCSLRAVGRWLQPGLHRGEPAAHRRPRACSSAAHAGGVPPFIEGQDHPGDRVHRSSR